ncbi:fumigaclavine A dimethylallyltransferase [Aspergillus lentulus]|uniref:Fumigaclavine A dimethylallyltransferase n=1 Tax=Aspergillus lentulus TaxID=293939 RepID=A0AAN4PD22_ASPLE|nr:hypothetical protein CNMCM6936_005604 [Aspergillus lentulus]GAQ03956.1 fumigaclavine A dimethylallyltransferase [Aspergillus lentulus]
MTKDTTQVSHSQEELRAPFEVLSRTLSFEHEDHRLWWEQGGSKLATYLKLARYSMASQYQHLLMFYSVYAPNLGPYPNEKRDNVNWVCAICPGGENLELSMNFQQRSKCTVRMAAETLGPLTGTEKDPTNVAAENKLIDDLRALQPDLNFTWFGHFEREVVVPKEVALNHKQAINSVPYKNQRLHGLDLAEGAFTLKSYFLPSIRSAVTGVDTTQIMFDSIRKLALGNPNFNSALDMLQDWMIPTRGRFMGDWDVVSYDAIDAEEARIKVYTGIKMESLEQAWDIWTLGGRLQGDVVDKGFELVKRLWGRLMDDEPSTCELKYCMQWVWELRTDVSIPVPKLYFTVAEAEDHYVSDAVVEILEYLGWDEHVQTHRALMDEAWSLNQTKESYFAFNYISVTYHSIKGPYITTYGNPSGPRPVFKE